MATLLTFTKISIFFSLRMILYSTFASWFIRQILFIEKCDYLTFGKKKETVFLRGDYVGQLYIKVVLETY